MVVTTKFYLHVINVRGVAVLKKRKKERKKLVKKLSELSKTDWVKRTEVQKVQIIIDSSVLLGPGRIRLKDLIETEYHNGRLLYVQI